ncbi:MAG TPA: diguanylate cyclase [Ramlibacter sp.]|nr:diguanylate cyclase [Ramlibacter sp.]
MNAARAAQLLAANEQLVLAVIRAQDEAVRATQALKDLSAANRVRELTRRIDGAVLFNHLVNAQSVARRNGGRLGLLLLSLGNLQEIHDTLGHAVGQQALELAGQRLLAAVRAGDSVSRQGSNEFLVLLPSVSQAADALAVADAIIAALALPGQVGGKTVRLQATIGISVYPDDGSDGDALIDRATAAMYSARRQGVGSFFFRGETGTDARSLELRLSESVRGPASPPADDNPTDTITYQREANEQLLLTALRTHELLSASELAYRRQTEFIGVVAHELRSPLGPITHAAALLGYLKTPEPMVPMVRQVIERQVTHMGRLVADLLDMTRISTGKLRLDIQRLDLVEVIGAALESVKPGIEAREQLLTESVPPGQLMVNGDRLRLTQVLVNLLGNASKYTQRSGALGLAVTASGSQVSIEVSDNGIGISPAALTHVFDPFVQEQHAASFDSTGLGIGLSLVRELVHGHNGQVKAASAGPGHGSCFTVTLELLSHE